MRLKKALQMLQPVGGLWLWDIIAPIVDSIVASSFSLSSCVILKCILYFQNVYWEDY